uniref:Uncharacterized protein n=1 Tax=Panagrolaimus sp. ES5 TaxID=591445 RepID=A0AC34GR57_9BILA
MKDCKENLDEWLTCLKEIENQEAVKANFELKLGQDTNWANKSLWESYFEFLKKNKRMDILDVYRKYTRLFISDKKAVEEYRNEIEKFSQWNKPTTKFWIDTIIYEMDFGDHKFACCLLKRATKAVLGKNFQIMATKKLDLLRTLQMFKEFKFMLSKKLYQIYMIHVGIQKDGEEVAGMEIFNIAKNATKLKFFEFFDLKNILDFSSESEVRKSELIMRHPKSDICETIYFDGYDLHLHNLVPFLVPESLKSVTLKNVTIKDVTNSLMNEKDIENFVKSKTNAHVDIQIN